MPREVAELLRPRADEGQAKLVLWDVQGFGIRGAGDDLGNGSCSWALCYIVEVPGAAASWGKDTVGMG